MFRAKLLEMFGEKVTKAIIDDDVKLMPPLIDKVFKEGGQKKLGELLVLAALSNATKIVEYFTNRGIGVTDEVIETYFDAINKLDIMFNPNSQAQMELMIADQNTPTEVLHVINHYMMQIETRIIIETSQCAKQLINCYLIETYHKCSADDFSTSFIIEKKIENAMIKINNMNQILCFVEQLFTDRKDRNYNMACCATIIVACAISMLKNDYSNDLHSLLESPQIVNLDKANIKEIAALRSYIKKALNIALKIAIDEISQSAELNQSILSYTFNCVFNLALKTSTFRRILNTAQNLPEMNIFDRLERMQSILLNEASTLYRNNEADIKSEILYIAQCIESDSNFMFTHSFSTDFAGEGKDKKMICYQVVVSEDVAMLKKLDAVLASMQENNKKTMGYKG